MAKRREPQANGAAKRREAQANATSNVNGASKANREREREREYNGASFDSPRRKNVSKVDSLDGDAQGKDGDAQGDAQDKRIIKAARAAKEEELDGSSSKEWKAMGSKRKQTEANQV